MLRTAWGGPRTGIVYLMEEETNMCMLQRISIAFDLWDAIGYTAGPLWLDLYALSYTLLYTSLYMSIYSTPYSTLYSTLYPTLYFTLFSTLFSNQDSTLYSTLHSTLYSTVYSSLYSTLYVLFYIRTFYPPLHTYICLYVSHSLVGPLTGIVYLMEEDTNMYML